MHRRFAVAAGVIVLSLSSNYIFAQVSLRGKVTDNGTGLPLSGAHVTGFGGATVSDRDGLFSLSLSKPGVNTLKVSYVGYTAFNKEFRISKDTVVDIRLTGTALLGEEVCIVGTRSGDKYPTANSTLTRQEISKINLGRDIPYLLLSTPSTVVTSDAGNGVGYTGFAIRGTDLTRINVTINSIPLNDPESQGVWFVDLPDIASSTGSIQVQRGVGTSTNGAGAFGATVNFMTSDLHQDPYGELDLSGGSFNTFKSTLRFGTGLMGNRISIDGRLSWIKSDGYIDRAASNLKSYYLAGGYYGKNTTVRLITFAGLERTYQAWEGVPKDSLATNRTYNPAGEYTNSEGKIVYYPDQTDNYLQNHYQALLSQRLSRSWNLNVALHYTKGKGYYENFKEGASFADYGLEDVTLGDTTITSTNLVNRKMMDNDFCGITYSAAYTFPDRLSLVVGGAWNRYYGRHFGKVIWATYASNGDNDRNWYYNTGLKKDFNIYAKATWRILKKLSLFGDLQYRYVDYRMEGTLDNLTSIDQRHIFNFFNPKAGLYYTLNDHHEAYFSFGIANREPSRNNYKDADPGKMPTNETLYDFELGYHYKAGIFSAEANLFYMDYKNQLVLTGEINNVGEAIMVNVPSSYRAGAELSAAVELFRKKLLWNITGTFSRNKIRDFTHYTDLYDADWNYLGQQSENLGTTDLSFSPNITAASALTWKPLTGLSVTLNSRYVGRQYIDNTSTVERSLHGYFTNGINAHYTLNPGIFDEIGFTLAVNNLFSVKYESNAWVYPYYLGGVYQEANGYFPQALVNVLFGITVKI